MSLARDIIDRVFFPNREVHAIPVLDGGFSPNERLDQARQLSSGDYFLGSRKVSFSSPGEALRNGVAMVYQETSLVPSTTVAQNLELGMEKFFTIYRKINIAAQQSQQALNFNVDPLALVETLGTAKRQMVEIARAVRHKAQVIIFDEPTASLTPEEMQHLFHLLDSLRSQGVGIIFISHALEEALKIADRITVLRDGKLVHTGWLLRDDDG
jgi:ABC-type sugar transport system ATPase subunit